MVIRRCSVSTCEVSGMTHGGEAPNSLVMVAEPGTDVVDGGHIADASTSPEVL
jgi:hypothetical protein